MQKIKILIILLILMQAGVWSAKAQGDSVKYSLELVKEDSVLTAKNYNGKENWTPLCVPYSNKILGYVYYGKDYEKLYKYKVELCNGNSFEVNGAGTVFILSDTSRIYANGYIYDNKGNIIKNFGEPVCGQISENGYCFNNQIFYNKDGEILWKNEKFDTLYQAEFPTISKNGKYGAYIKCPGPKIQNINKDYSLMVYNQKGDLIINYPLVTYGKIKFSDTEDYLFLSNNEGITIFSMDTHSIVYTIPKNNEKLCGRFIIDILPETNILFQVYYNKTNDKYYLRLIDIKNNVIIKEMIFDMKEDDFQKKTITIINNQEFILETKNLIKYYKLIKK